MFVNEIAILLAHRMISRLSATQSLSKAIQMPIFLFCLDGKFPAIGREFPVLMPEKTVLMAVMPPNTKKVAAKPPPSSSLYEDKSFAAANQKTKRDVSSHPAYQLFFITLCGDE